MLACGIDVSASHGLDVVVLESKARLFSLKSHLSVSELPDLLKQIRSDVVAIDAPSCWSAGGRSRDCERRLAARGLHCFYTPTSSIARGSRFYRWVRVGHRVFEAANQAGYPTYLGNGSMRRHAIEVFPHASAVVLRKTLPPPGCSRRRSAKKKWRTRILKDFGVDTEKLTSLDLVDAALAALTGIRALEKDVAVVGDRTGGVIVLPARRLLDMYRRE
jgi:predicted nuclease with RNAse H fold